MTPGSRLAFLVATSMIVASCSSSPDLEPDQELSWSSLKDQGLRGEDEVAVYFSSFFDAPSTQSHLGLIQTDGTSRFLPLEWHEAAVLASGSNELCVTTRTETLFLSHDAGERWRRGGYPGSGHWSGVLDDGSCVHVLNSGVAESGYETDVYWRNGEGQMHGVVPAAPGPSGQSPDAIWVRDTGTTDLPSKVSLYKVDLNSGAVTVEASWSSRVRSGRVGRSDLYFGNNHASDLFWHDGRLHYLEDLTATNSEGSSVEIRPGFSAQLRLASIDPATGRNRSTRLRETANGLLGSVGSSGGAAATIAMRKGHVFGDSLFTANGSGELFAVDLTSRRMEKIGALSPTALSAVEAAAAWKDHRLALVLVSAKQSVTREDYDLRTGKLVASTELAGFKPLLDGARYLSSAAILE